MNFKRQLWGLDKESVNQILKRVEEQFIQEKHMLLEKLSNLEKENAYLQNEIQRLIQDQPTESKIKETVMEKLWQEYFNQTLAVFDEIRELENLDQEFEKIEQSYTLQKESLVRQLKQKFGEMEI